MLEPPLRPYAPEQFDALLKLVNTNVPVILRAALGRRWRAWMAGWNQEGYCSGWPDDMHWYRAGRLAREGRDEREAAQRSS